MRPLGNGEKLLPINYQYPAASWIYKTIAGGDADYARWLHENGFADGSKTFKMFCFSGLTTPNARLNGDRLMLADNDIYMHLSFLPERSTQEFVKGMFSNQEFFLGDRQSKVNFRVSSVEMLPEPHFAETMDFQCLSPITVSMKRDDGTKKYLSPMGEGYGKALIDNLLAKYSAYFGQTVELTGNEKFELLNKPRMKGIFIPKAGLNMPIKVIAYNFQFRITAPIPLLQIGYTAGFGQENSMGFGCVGGTLGFNIGMEN